MGPGCGSESSGVCGCQKHVDDETGQQRGRRGFEGREAEPVPPCLQAGESTSRRGTGEPSLGMPWKLRNRACEVYIEKEPLVSGTICIVVALIECVYTDVISI